MSAAITCELLIVGAGPAGIACALQARRDGLNALVIGDEPVGGLVCAAHRLDNLPGYPRGIGGEDFAHLLDEQAQRQGLDILQDKISECRREADGRFRAISVSGRIVISRAVVLAVGTKPRDFSVFGGDEAFHSGRIHRDIRSLPRRLNDRHVAIVGGGEAALDSALSIIHRGGTAEIFHRGETLRCQSSLAAETNDAGIAVRTGKSLRQLQFADDRLSLHWVDEMGEENSTADFLLACIGRLPHTELLAQLNPATAMDVISAVPGIFLAGDVIRGYNRYVATAMGDGQRAALAAGLWLNPPTREAK